MSRITTFGQCLSNYRDVRDALNASHLAKLDFLVLPLFHPRLRRDCMGISHERLGPGTRSDRELECNDWTSNVVGKVSDWIDCDGVDAAIQSSSEAALRQELAWATHLGLQAVILPPPSNNSPNYARILSQVALSISYQQIWVRIPLITPLESRNRRHSTHSSSMEFDTDGWKLWDSFRHSVGHNPRISVALEISENFSESDLVGELPASSSAAASSSGSTSPISSSSTSSPSPTPSSSSTSSSHGNNNINNTTETSSPLSQRFQTFMNRWRAEPVKAIILHTRIFLTNKKGFPVLSHTQQAALGTLLQYKLQIIFAGKPRHASGLLPYIQYMQHLKTKYASEMSEEEKFCSSYRDTLQSPLQPLMDNLESQTYETFERDPVKYDRYEAAIALALVDMAKARNLSCYSSDHADMTTTSTTTTTTNADSDDYIVVTVVGAGRGPLVACALSASNSTGVPIRVYAVEKNQNAIITLRNRVLTERWTNVQVFACDMRLWRPPRLADILVSELLGSWGDNELSPECLDGAQVCLKPDGISIPYNYTSYVAPISSSKLWMSARELLGGNGLDTPFVVMFHNCFHLTPPQPCFYFSHPNPLPPYLIDNRRFTTLSFKAPLSSTVHGFAGTFESVLYKDVMISIRPETHSPNMFSWFPLFIPLTNPVRVNQGDTITINIWRCTSDRKVWYEWQLASPICSPIQNANGKAYWIGL